MYEDSLRISQKSPKVLELYRHIDIPVPALVDKKSLIFKMF